MCLVPIMKAFSLGSLAVFYYKTNHLVLTCTCGGIHPGRVEPASPRHGNVPWVGSTTRSPVPSSLHLLALQLKPSLSCLWAPEHSLFTPSYLLVFILVTRSERKGKEFDQQRCDDCAAIYWTVLYVNRCSIYCSALAYRPIDTNHLEKFLWSVC